MSTPPPPSLIREGWVYMTPTGPGGAFVGLEGPCHGCGAMVYTRFWATPANKLNEPNVCERCYPTMAALWATRGEW